MITLHHLNNSRSQRILWLLEELELPHEIAIYQRDEVTRRAPDAPAGLPATDARPPRVSAFHLKKAANTVLASSASEPDQRDS
jgi:hypothetical protein